MIGMLGGKRSTEEIERQITRELAEMAPLLGIHACDLALTSFDDAGGVANLYVAGECSDCDASAETFLPGIETRLKLKVAELQVVRIQKGAR